MNSKLPKALLLVGGWHGHEPSENADLIATALQDRGFSCKRAEDLDILDDASALREFDLIVPIWTMGTISEEREKNLCEAVRAGSGLAGTHGGMGDAFRGSLSYQWMIGGHFVAHPHVGPYTITVTEPTHPLMAGMPREFEYVSEQYYMLVDPGIEVLAKTRYEHDGKICDMPVVWTKTWGAGKIFFSALGHRMEEFEKWPFVFEMTVRGHVWAARRR